MKKISLLITILFVVTISNGLAATVKENWEKHCQKCHGADGKGQTKMGRQSGAKDYTDPKVQAELQGDRLRTRRIEGLAEAPQAAT